MGLTAAVKTRHSACGDDIDSMKPVVTIQYKCHPCTLTHCFQIKLHRLSMICAQAMRAFPFSGNIVELRPAPQICTVIERIIRLYKNRYLPVGIPIEVEVYPLYIHAYMQQKRMWLNLDSREPLRTCEIRIRLHTVIVRYSVYGSVL